MDMGLSKKQSYAVTEFASRTSLPSPDKVVGLTCLVSHIMNSEAAAATIALKASFPTENVFE